MNLAHAMAAQHIRHRAWPHVRLHSSQSMIAMIWVSKLLMLVNTYTIDEHY
jgi:hypothetical protein